MGYGLRQINQDIALQYISFHIYQLHFRKFCPTQKQYNNIKNLSISEENNSHRLSNFLSQIHVF